MNVWNTTELSLKNDYAGESYVIYILLHLKKNIVVLCNYTLKTTPMTAHLMEEETDSKMLGQLLRIT